MIEKIDKLSHVLSLKGNTFKDSFWIGLAKIPFILIRIFTKSTNLGYFLLRDCVAKTSYGLFFCRKRNTDLGFVSESFESEIVDIFRQCSGTVIDCGAHIGKYTIMASKLVGEEGKVIAIEPHPRNYEMLIKNLSLNGCKNVVPLNCAVWNKNEKVNLFLHDDDTEHSLRRDNGKLSIVVDAFKLDDLLNGMNIDKVDWMKIDVEGVEKEVLVGAEKSLRRGIISNIIIELHRGVDREGVWSMLKENGYSIRQVKNYTIAKKVD